jgi:hypothetical protein
MLFLFLCLDLAEKIQLVDSYGLPQLRFCWLLCPLFMSQTEEISIHGYAFVLLFFITVNLD